MSELIRFDGVSKRFQLNTGQPRSLQQLLLSFAHKEKHARREDYWALRDVSFGVKAGETVGFIGPNGAGKSTVLKLISRIINPTYGRIEVQGRVGALLELGAGFHPDLSGRENIYLNGSILGLKRSDLRARLDEIIHFSEVERFIDVPVKHYSSGMYVRLGFSIAVHLDPDILLVDEVLAVGDAAFQRKCIERIDAMRREGVTILLVSHSLDTIRSMCSRAIWLDGGQVAAEGPSDDMVRDYIRRSYATSQAPQLTEDKRWGTREIEIERVRLVNAQGEVQPSFAVGEPVDVEMYYRAHRRVERPVFGLAIHHSGGAHITGPNTQFSCFDIPSLEGEGCLVYRIPRLPLLEGMYHLTVAVRNWEDTVMYDYHDRAYPLLVSGDGCYERYGAVTLFGAWERR